MKLCGSLHGKNRCILPEGHELPRFDAWDGASGATWTEGDTRRVYFTSGRKNGKSHFVLMMQLGASLRELAQVTEALAAKHIYLDPLSASPDAAARSYCSLCLRYGLGMLAIDHAESCLVGKAVKVLASFEAQVALASGYLHPHERTSANGSVAPVEQEGPVRVPQHSAELRVEYFAESPRNKFNPYRHPCQAITGGLVCELEHGHTGAHCSDGSVWADDGRRFADAQ